MAIRYNKQLNAEIHKAVRSFNAKVRRLQAKGVSAALLPDLISTKSIKANADNRRQLRNKLQALQEFSSRGQTFKSEGGVTGTTVLFQYNTKRANKAVKQLQRELNALEQIPTRYPMMKSESSSLLQSKINYLKRDIYKLDIRQINIMQRNVESTFKSRERNALFHQNFKKMLMSVAYRAGLDTGYIKSIGDKLDQLPPAKLLELYRTNPAFGIIEWYKPEYEELGSDTVKAAYDSIENDLDEEIAKG